MVMLLGLRLVGMDGSEIEVVSRVIYATDARAAQNMVSTACVDWLRRASFMSTMPLYHLNSDSIEVLPDATFAQLRIYECSGAQWRIKANVRHQVGFIFIYAIFACGVPDNG